MENLRKSQKVETVVMHTELKTHKRKDVETPAHFNYCLEIQKLDFSIFRKFRVL